MVLEYDEVIFFVYGIMKDFFVGLKVLYFFILSFIILENYLEELGM